MKKNFLLDTSISILLVTIISFCGVGYYEIGYCKYFKIPIEYISIDLTRYGFLLFGFIATFFFFTMICDPLFSHFADIVKIKNKFVRILVGLLFIGLLIYLFSDTLSLIGIQEASYLFGTSFFGLILILNANKEDTSYEMLNPRYSISIVLSRQFGKIVGPLLISASVICALLFYSGYSKAKNQKIFFAKPDNKTLLLKKYGDNVIYGHFENNQFSSIIIERNLVAMDTLRQIEIK